MAPKRRLLGRVGYWRLYLVICLVILVVGAVRYVSRSESLREYNRSLVREIDRVSTEVKELSRLKAAKGLDDGDSHRLAVLEQFLAEKKAEVQSNDELGWWYSVRGVFVDILPWSILPLPFFLYVPVWIGRGFLISPGEQVKP